jgi:PST family polysaccharide transporter
MSLVVFPLAVGLGVVAPTLIRSLLPDQWQGVAPLLVVLSMLSVVRPMGWGVSAYLSAFSRTRAIMMLQLLKLVLLFGCMIAFSSLGPVWTAGSVGIAFGVQSLVAIGLVIITDAVPVWPLVGAVVRPLAACAVMAAAVIGVRGGLGALNVRVLLVIEIACAASRSCSCSRTTSTRSRAPAGRSSAGSSTTPTSAGSACSCSSCCPAS